MTHELALAPTAIFSVVWSYVALSCAACLRHPRATRTPIAATVAATTTSTMAAAATTAAAAATTSATATITDDPAVVPRASPRYTWAGEGKRSCCQGRPDGHGRRWYLPRYRAVESQVARPRRRAGPAAPAPLRPEP